MSDPLWPHGLQHARPPCPSPTPSVYSNSRPSSQWCHPAISSSVAPFSSCLQSFLASGSFLMSQFFTSGYQSIGASASASVLPMNIQDWFPLGWTGWISLTGWLSFFVYSGNFFCLCCTACGDLSWTQAHGSEITKSWPLHHQGSPSENFKKISCYGWNLNSYSQSLSLCPYPL